MVLPRHGQNLLILHTKNRANGLTEKAYFFGRMALWHQITRILSKPHLCVLLVAHAASYFMGAAHGHGKRSAPLRCDAGEIFATRKVLQGREETRTSYNERDHRGASSMQRLWAMTGGIVCATLLCATPALAIDSAALWALLQRGGQVVVMRHAATEPGVGDPPGFRLDDCRTQRNLSAVGREEARRLGAAVQARGVPIGQVLSSRWCRCLETARLAFGPVEPWLPLDSFFHDRSREATQTPIVRQRAGERPPPGIWSW